MDSPWITVVVIMALPLGFIIVPAMVDLVTGWRRKEGVRSPTTR